MTGNNDNVYFIKGKILDCLLINIRIVSGTLEKNSFPCGYFFHYYPAVLF